VLAVAGATRIRLGPARQFDMSHRRFGRLVPQRGAHRTAGQRLERRGADEAVAFLGHRHLHLAPRRRRVAGPGRPPCTRDAAAHAQQDALPFRGSRTMVRKIPTAEAVVSLPDALHRPMSACGLAGNPVGMHIRDWPAANDHARNSRPRRYGACPMPNCWRFSWGPDCAAATRSPPHANC
jgi:hypothetical protein